MSGRSSLFARVRVLLHARACGRHLVRDSTHLSTFTGTKFSFRIFAISSFSKLSRSMTCSGSACSPVRRSVGLELRTYMAPWDHRGPQGGGRQHSASQPGAERSERTVTRRVADAHEQHAVVFPRQRQRLRRPQLPAHRVSGVRSNLRSPRPPFSESRFGSLARVRARGGEEGKSVWRT